MKKIVLGITAIIIAAGIGLFISCEKADVTAAKNATVVNNATEVMTKGDQKMFTLAIIKSPKENLEPTLLFCIDSVEAQINVILKEYYGSSFTFNDISINDDDPLSSKSEPFLAFSITDIKNGETMTGFMPITKRVNGGDNPIEYQASGQERIKIKCKGINCDGCTLNATRTGCEPCRNNDGKCETVVTYSSGPTLWDALERIADKLISILGK